MSWTVTVLIICAVAAVVKVWKEYSRPDRSYRLLRMIACLLAIIAMGCIAVPIYYTKDVIVPNDHTAILLTPGFDKDSLANYKISQIFTRDRSIAKEYPRAKLIRPDELKKDTPALKQLHVFGYGLTENELGQLDSLRVVFHQSSLPDGITSVNWDQKLNAGETLRVQGKYKNDNPKPVKLILRGLGTTLDTISIAPKANQEFELSTVPKNEGRAVYHLQAIVGTDTLANESLPVEIAPLKLLKVLILSASPDFETRFLKNWLSENGFSIAVRSAISKDKFSSEFVNMQPLKIDRLNNGLLDKFDLVIGDLSVLKTESAVFKEQVTQKGLGVIAHADSSSKASSWLQNDFPVEQLNIKNLPPAALIIKGKKDKTSPLRINPDFIRFEPGTQPLVNDVQGHIVASSGLAGSGRMVFTSINNTYNWMLNGNKDDYGAFWSLLVGNAARKIPVTEEWSVSNQFPSANEPVNLKLSTSASPGQIVSEGVGLAPAQNPTVPFEWDNTYWPSKPGWNEVKQNNGKPYWWYVFTDKEWASAKAAEKITATSNYAGKNPANSSVTKPIHEKVKIELPKFYFYILLLITCVFLWVEGKGALPMPAAGRQPLR